MKTDIYRMVLEAVVIFHSASPWDAAKNMRWQVICQSVLKKPDPYQKATGVQFAATTKVLCDLVRAALQGTP